VRARIKAPCIGRTAAASVRLAEKMSTMRERARRFKIPNTS
jgi:hypothetical protein